MLVKYEQGKKKPKVYKHSGSAGISAGGGGINYIEKESKLLKLDRS
jgi:hypothetical protein